ncbi:hypothetical protein A6R68_23834 [Neotoma lepida]|uniref:Uncharacterized protein n=1 Tax=Neotoma lepida TaxID=56216 RepID=A0A1A6HUQ1_NEOLE|nr:hypothetical protein A6R68_23834 [Neotoma lepida]
MSISSDEAVAYGAAVQEAILPGDESENVQYLLLLGVIPLPFCTETAGAQFHHPYQADTDLHPNSDNQPGVTFTPTPTTSQVYEGGRAVTEDSNLLGEFGLTDIPSVPHSISQIEVTVDIDANGVLSVSAVGQGTQKENKVTITSDGAA